jgi:plastocyanin
MIVPVLLQTAIVITCLFPGSLLHAGEVDITVIEVKLGDYRFTPQEIQLIAEQPAVLHLVNTDSITPHNFTIETTSGSPAIDADIPPGESVDVRIPPLPAGQYTFYCGNKLLFMKSHREKGMEGTFIVGPE